MTPMDRDRSASYPGHYVTVWEFYVGRGSWLADMLRDFELAAVLQIRGDVGGPEGVVPDPGLDAGDACAPVIVDAGCTGVQRVRPAAWKV